MKVQFHTSMEVSFYERLKALSKKNDKPMNAIIVEAFVKQWDENNNERIAVDDNHAG